MKAVFILLLMFACVLLGVLMDRSINYPSNYVFTTRILHDSLKMLTGALLWAVITKK
jgi:hypothetical protein